MSPSATKNIVLTLQKGLNFTLQFLSMPCLQPEGRGKRGVCVGMGWGGGLSSKTYKMENITTSFGGYE